MLLTLTLARSGTTLLTSAFRATWGDEVRVEHEPLRHDGRLRHLFRCFDTERQEFALADPVIGGLVRSVVESAERHPVLIFGNTISHLAPVFHRVLGARLRLLHLHRNPLANAASTCVMTRPEWWTNIPKFEDDPLGIRITPFDPHARFVEYRNWWSWLSLFEMVLYQWLERHAFAREIAVRMPEIPFISLPSGDLFRDPKGTMRMVARFAGIESGRSPLVRQARRNQTWSRSLEQRPLGDAWRAMRRIPPSFSWRKSWGTTWIPCDWSGR